MIFLEAFLFTVLFFVLVSTSLSDLRTGKVPNKTVLVGLVIGVLAAVPYYAIFARDCLVSYMINNALAFGISIVLYSSGIWGAGDCKLLCSVILIFPARLYCMNNRSMASCFLLISLVFITAFFYVLVETVYLGGKNKNLFQMNRINVRPAAYIKSFLFFFLFLNLWNVLFSLIVPGYVLEDILLVTAIHFVLLLFIMKIEHRVSWPIIGIMSACWIVFLFCGIAHFSVSNINWKTYLVIILLILFRSSAEKYNYKEIDVADLRPGMILSFASTLRFSDSKTQGLPPLSSEDLRSRLSVEQVESVNRWAKAKSDRNSIVIVRKIPFALFIAIGTMVFSVVEVFI